MSHFKMSQILIANIKSPFIATIYNMACIISLLIPTFTYLVLIFQIKSYNFITQAV